MAKTKTTPGPKPRYGEREEIHIALPKDDLDYIRSQSSSLTEWIIKAIKIQREYEETERAKFHGHTTKEMRTTVQEEKKR